MYKRHMFQKFEIIIEVVCYRTFRIQIGLLLPKFDSFYKNRFKIGSEKIFWNLTKSWNYYITFRFSTRIKCF